MSEPKLNLVSTTDAPTPDPFDLDALRLDQKFAETAGVKKLLLTVPVHKPKPQDFVRVHPSPAFRADFPVIELKEDRETFIVAPGLVGGLAAEIVPMSLFTAANRQGVVFLWPVRLPDPNGRQQEWRRSLREAVDTAVGQWVRVKANMSLGAYEVATAASAMVEPEWPEATFQDLIKLAFRDRLIDTPDHPVIKRLRGL
jgi:hypothetical protein